MRDISRRKFKLLQAFVLVAEHGSFKRAAERSFRSHSAVRVQMKVLEAQRDACEAYIKSQAGEGWSIVKTKYNDGGLSGGDDGAPCPTRSVR